MYPEVVDIDGNIELVQNSGIQFIDYDVLLDWKDKDPSSVLKAIENGYFMRSASKEEPLVRLVPKISDHVYYVDPLSERKVEIENANYVVPLKQSLDLYNGVWFPVPFILEHALNNQDKLHHYGPINWVRARIIKVDDPSAINAYQIAKGYKQKVNSAVRYYMDAKEGSVSADEKVVTQNSMHKLDSESMLSPSQSYYRVVLAFDTKTQDFDESAGYFAPTNRDIESGVRFKLAYNSNQCQSFLKGTSNASLPWVREWAQAVCRDLYKERVQNRILDEDLNTLIRQDKVHEAHYLNVLAFLGFMINIKPVHFIANKLTTNNMTPSKIIDVSLILDIGNSRSCGIMVEDHPNVTRGDDDFSDTYVLTLRDLNAPEIVYNEPFASRVEFSRPNFDYDNRSARSGRPDAFVWPSMVRVGKEASNLASHREGNEGTTGLISPKRYLWNCDRLVNDRWIFNSYSYLIDSKKLRDEQKEQVQRAFLNSVGTFFNTDGNAYFALKEDDNVYDNLESCYSPRSTMTFMLIEIFLHAMSQMNSLAQREQCSSKNTPRRLKSIILTTPPSMAAEEKELYRACVYEALGILWKSLGLDTSAPTEFNFKDQNMNIPIPNVYMDWNEAEAGQVVYIYNESQKTFQGNCKAFISSLRRPLMSKPRLGESLVDGEGNKLISARIASIDIGGGTTDLVIKDYSFRESELSFASDMRPHEVLKDGFKIAGDDVVHDLIKECIMTRLALSLAKHKVLFKPVLQQLVGEVNSGNVRNEVLRSQFTQQILVKIAHKILFHLEHLDPYALKSIVKGSVRDFILDKEINDNLPITIKRPGPESLPSNEVILFVDNIMGQYLRGFSIMDFKLSFDLVKIHKAMLEGSKFNLCRILSKLGEVLSTFEVDLLLLTGKTSKLPAIRAFFNQRLNLPSARILPMHKYRCDSWYPFKHEGEFIGDPKTTAAVGALLCYLRLSHDKFPNFRFYSYPEEVTNNAHYVGIIDNSNMISDDAVLYKYESSKMLSKMNESNEEDEESNFVPYKRQDEEFKTQLAVEIGYRLLDDANFEATPLYKIEAYNSVDEIKRVKKALALNYKDLSPLEVEGLIEKLDFEIQEQYSIKAKALLNKLALLNSAPVAVLNNNNSVPELVELKGQLEKALYTQVCNSVEGSFDEPSGLKGLFASKNKIQEQKQALISARYQEQYASAVQKPLEEKLQSLIIENENLLGNLLNEAIEHNITLLRQRFERGFESLKRKLNIERSQFNVSLRKVNRSSPYPLAFIKRNLPHLKMVESFELDKVVSSDGIDYTPYFKMYLKTISGAKVKYFMDSGAIDLNGINPRFVL